eukprot:11221964-Lingulodinium_polyedra.AAC.1
MFVRALVVPARGAARYAQDRPAGRQGRASPLWRRAARFKQASTLHSAFLALRVRKVAPEPIRGSLAAVTDAVAPGLRG